MILNYPTFALFFLQYSMKSRQSSQGKKQLYFPLLDHYNKHKRYYYHQQNKENALKGDLDNIIDSLVSKTPPCQIRMQQHHLKYLANKIFLSTNALTPTFQTKLSPSLKSLRVEINNYMEKLAQPQQLPKGDYAEFMRLSQESQDYLEFYLKHHFKNSQHTEIIQAQQKAVILSLLKTNYKCLTDNPPQIANRILLSLGLNPLNDFHFVHWPAFARFRKLATHNPSKSEAKQFLVDYLIPNSNKSLSRGQFWSIISGVVRKLQNVISSNNVARLIERVQEMGNYLIPQQLNRISLQNLLVTEPIFLWQELVRLIFLI